MAVQRMILLFIDNKKEELNLCSYFRASSCTLRVAREMSDFRNYLKNQLIDFIIIDSSVNAYGVDLIKIMESIKTPYYYLAESPSDKFLPKIIQKPYAFSNIVNLIQDKIGLIDFDQKKGEQYFTEQQYTSVKIEEVINLKVAPFDYFVKINDSKYVRIAKEGMHVATQILTNVQGKGVHVIYSKKEDYRKYLEKMTQSSLNINKMNIPKEVKIRFLAKTSDLIFDQIVSEGVSREMFHSSKQVLDSSMELIMEDDNVFNLLKSLNDLDENSYRHSLGMAMYSVLIAKQLTWETENTIFKLSLGALFADIGLKTLPKNIIDNSKIWIDGPDLELYKKHPIFGANLLKQGKDIHQDIIDIVEQHHENCDGTGYPKQLSRTTIHPLAKLVRVADEFCEYALKTQSNPNPPAPKEIVQRLLSSSNKKFEYKYLVALAKVFNIPIPEAINVA